MGRKTKEPEQQENADRGLEVIEGELGTASKIRHVRSEGSLGVAAGKIYFEGQEVLSGRIKYDGVRNRSLRGLCLSAGIPAGLKFVG